LGAHSRTNIRRLVLYLPDKRGILFGVGAKTLQSKYDIYRRHCDEGPPVGVQHCVELGVLVALFFKDKSERGKYQDLKEKGEFSS
jgi:hypothetical protein